MNWLDLCISFVTVAETGGIRAASRRLQVTPMAISKQIKQLEQKLGQALFSRSTRNLKLTEFGTVFLIQAKTLVASGDNLLNWLDNSSGQPQGVIEIIVLNEFADFIVDYLREFNQLYPKIVIKLHGYAKAVDPNQDQFDLVFGSGEYIGRLQPGLVRRQMARFSADFYASKDYLKKHGTPHSISDLGQHLFVTSTQNSPSNFVIIRGGDQILNDGSTEFISVTESMIASNYTSQIAIASQGFGIAQLPTVLPACQMAVKSGDLVRILEPLSIPDFPLYLFYKKTDHPQPKIKAFLDFYMQKVDSFFNI